MNKKLLLALLSSPSVLSSLFLAVNAVWNLLLLTPDTFNEYLLHNLSEH